MPPGVRGARSVTYLRHDPALGGSVHPDRPPELHGEGGSPFEPGQGGHTSGNAARSARRSSGTPMSARAAQAAAVCRMIGSCVR